MIVYYVYNDGGNNGNSSAGSVSQFYCVMTLFVAFVSQIISSKN